MELGIKRDSPDRPYARFPRLSQVWTSEHQNIRLSKRWSAGECVKGGLLGSHTPSQKLVETRKWDQEPSQILISTRIHPHIIFYGASEHARQQDNRIYESNIIIFLTLLQNGPDQIV